MVGENIFLMKCQKTVYVKRKTVFRRLIRVDDCGLEKRNNMVRISLVSGSALGTILRALVQHSTLAKKSYDYQHKPGKWAEVNMNP
jgi:hypothetical protein